MLFLWIVCITQMLKNKYMYYYWCYGLDIMLMYERYSSSKLAAVFWCTLYIAIIVFFLQIINIILQMTSHNVWVHKLTTATEHAGSAFSALIWISKWNKVKTRCQDQNQDQWSPDQNHSHNWSLDGLQDAWTSSILFIFFYFILNALGTKLYM